MQDWINSEHRAQGADSKMGSVQLVLSGLTGFGIRFEEYIDRVAWNIRCCFSDFLLYKPEMFVMREKSAIDEYLTTYGVTG